MKRKSNLRAGVYVIVRRRGVGFVWKGIVQYFAESPTGLFIVIKSDRNKNRKYNMARVDIWPLRTTE